MTTTQMKEGSTAYTKIHNVLKHYPWYTNFLKNDLLRPDYLKVLLENKSALENAGLNEDQIHLSSRFPLNDEVVVDEILKDLVTRNIIASQEYPKEKFELLAEQIYSTFEHGSYLTYIFPEEARLLYALTYITKPKSMLFLGSYYGYWAIWAAPVLKEFGGEAYLIDIDSQVIALAQKNMEKLGVDSVVHCIHDDALSYLAKETRTYDFIVVDPEGPKQGDNPDLLDKAIYYPMMKSAHPFLSQDGLVLCHNILLNNPLKEDTYFAKKIEYNYGQFTKFLPFMKAHYDSSVWYDTTEGVGIFAHKNNKDAG